MKKLIKKQIVIIAGVSAVGKNTIIAALMKRSPNQYRKIISYTTRPKRDGEVNGVNYHYVNRDQFEEKLHSKEIFEFTQI